MRFAHIADTHIRNLKYHYEYREVFKQLYKSLAEEKVDYIIHCGDIAHTKTQISPEFVDMCREFFDNLAKIAPTYIILGNHDGNLKNSSREDAITPIVKAMSNKNLILLKNAGEVKIDDNFYLNVLSVFDEDNWTPPSNEDAINIALYHGAIDKSLTDTNWTLGGDHDISIFDKFDFAFLGDIHKTQMLDKQGRIWYAGSTVQQNFGESLDKGYLLWDIESKDDFTTKHIAFKNPRPFITIPLTEMGDLPESSDVPEGARLRVVSDNNVSLDKVRKAVDIVKYKYNPESVTYLNRAAGKQVRLESAEGLEQKDLRDVKTQEELIENFLKDYGVSEEVLDKVFSLNRSYNTQIEESEDIQRNVHWSLRSLEWDHLFNYGKSNVIDFTKLEGIVGIFGKNYSGKSSIVDSLLYTLYNSTSKSIRKNLNIINQNQDSCRAAVEIQIDDNNYHIERKSEKYVKKLKGEETLEAKTDLEFYKQDLIGNKTILNGTSRQSTDKAVRKYFGSLEDFLMTSMASQLDSLAFINEGSTKRKEILAKFLDLEIFDKKFKLAKEEVSLTKASLRKLENRDFDGDIASIKKQIFESDLSIASNKDRCNTLKENIKDLSSLITELDRKIQSVPNEIIDPDEVSSKISKTQASISRLREENSNLKQSLLESQIKFEKMDDFIEQFNVESFKEKKKLIEQNEEDLKRFLQDMKLQSEERTRNMNKQDLLNQVPCGNSFPDCKFIKDAHESTNLLQITENRMSNLSQEIDACGARIRSLEPEKVDSFLDKYQQLLEKKNELATTIASSNLSHEKNENMIFKQTVQLDDLRSKLEDYNANKDVIEGLKDLVKLKKQHGKALESFESELGDCEKNVMQLHKQNGSLEEKLNSTINDQQEYETLKTNYAAYDLLMTCCHPNGISYDIIKERLPIINQEIAKILTNIVDFEIFIQNDDKKLDIFIKHPKHDHRPLEMGSGAEKTIASMAIRLALLTVSSLPKSDLFILDEPGTALDEENMEGFVRILDMVKSYFKTVILISHLDSLKDCVDMQINIERKDGYAHVNI